MTDISPSETVKKALEEAREHFIVAPMTSADPWKEMDGEHIYEVRVALYRGFTEHSKLLDLRGVMEAQGLNFVGIDDKRDVTYLVYRPEEYVED